MAHRVVIIGGGFGGLYAAQSLKNAPVEVTLLDQRNFHVFQPLLYQVATGWLSPANIASTLRSVLKRQQNTRVLLGQAIDIDIGARQVILSDGSVPYDTLIVATGSRHHYFGHDQWEALAPGLKTIEDATEMRRRIFLAFEAAEKEPEANKRKDLLTFVIVGGGPTGVELAGALAEITRDILRNDFRMIDPASAKIQLLEAAERILPTYPPDLSAKAASFLTKEGVTVRTGVTVTDIRRDCVVVREGQGSEEIPCRTTLWAAGVKASFLGKILAEATGAKLDRAGRVLVEPDMTLPSHPEIFVVGDLANYPHQTGSPLPGVAQVAIQEGEYAAKVIVDRLEGKRAPPFHYHDRGDMAIVGRGTAVARLKRFHLAGFFAWLAWLFVHIANLIEFENKLLVLIQWGWAYFRRNRAARLITGEHRMP
ncbi:MAG TPA: NAD(P)/FAD-dependent oxidoreductase [Candidatus Binatia bacterium]|jgi:NADH dehydrogenase